MRMACSLIQTVVFKDKPGVKKAAKINAATEGQRLQKRLH